MPALEEFSAKNTDFDKELAQLIKTISIPYLNFHTPLQHSLFLESALKFRKTLFNVIAEKNLETKREVLDNLKFKSEAVSQLENKIVNLSDHILRQDRSPFMELLALECNKEENQRKIDEWKKSFIIRLKQLEQTYYFSHDESCPNTTLEFLSYYAMEPINSVISARKAESPLRAACYYIETERFEECYRVLTSLKGWQRALVKPHVNELRHRLETQFLSDVNILLNLSKGFIPQ